MIVWRGLAAFAVSSHKFDCGEACAGHALFFLGGEFEEVCFDVGFTFLFLHCG